MVTHYHPDRGLIIDRIPSGSDFDVITYNQRAGLAPRLCAVDDCLDRREIEDPL